MDDIRKELAPLRAAMRAPGGQDKTEMSMFKDRS